MSPASHLNGRRPSKREIWLTSLVKLGLQLTSAPNAAASTTKAGELR
jgi:hypothetical protein